MANNRRIVKSVGIEPYILIAAAALVFGYLGSVMGAASMFRTMIATAYDLIINTVFFVMGVAVLSGAFGALLSEFGVTALINRLLSPLMKPLYGLPGASAIGIITTYFSDNPAIITLAEDEGFKRYFRRYQLPALTNLGTAYGMGFVVSTFFMSQASKGESFIVPVVIGNIGAVVGSIVSVRIMLMFSKKYYGTEEWASDINKDMPYDMMKYREIRSGSAFQRGLEAVLDGGKLGVDTGLSIIPGVVIICTFVMMLTYGPKDPSVGYKGLAYEGVAILPKVGRKLLFIFRPLLGLKDPETFTFPITSLGSVGAALGLVPKLMSLNLIGGNEIAVFIAMGMCWSGYLSTHVAMMDALGSKELTGKAILSHTIGGVAAGMAAHFLYAAFAHLM